MIDPIVNLAESVTRYLISRGYDAYLCEQVAQEMALEAKRNPAIGKFLAIELTSCLQARCLPRYLRKQANFRAMKIIRDDERKRFSAVELDCSDGLEQAERAIRPAEEATVAEFQNMLPQQLRRTLEAIWNNKTKREAANDLGIGERALRERIKKLRHQATRYGFSQN